MVVLTTPNVEYNVNYPGLANGNLRHADHRFEWTRAEFEAWAGAMGESYSYGVEFRSIGDVDEIVGSPTQMALFTLADTQITEIREKIDVAVAQIDQGHGLNGQEVVNRLRSKLRTAKESR